MPQRLGTIMESATKWLAGTLGNGCPQLADGEWLFATVAQSFAAITALAGIFGVYKLQVLRTSVEAETRLLQDRLRTLAEAFKLVPHDLGGVNLDRPQHPLDLFKALETALPRVREVVAASEVAPGVGEAFGRIIELQMPHNDFVAALSRYGYSVKESSRVRGLVAVSMGISAAVTAAALLLLLVAPVLASRQGTQDLSIAMIALTALGVVALVFVIVVSVKTLFAARRVLDVEGPAVPTMMQVRMSDEGVDEWTKLTSKRAASDLRQDQDKE